LKLVFKGQFLNPSMEKGRGSVSMPDGVCHAGGRGPLQFGVIFIVASQFRDFHSYMLIGMVFIKLYGHSLKPAAF